MIEFKKIEKAAYLQERNALKYKEIDGFKEAWIRKIRLPNKCENIYYDMYKKSEKEFFNCIANSYKCEEEFYEWVVLIEQILEQYDEKAVENVCADITDKLKEHPFILFSACFVNYLEFINTVTNKVIKNTLKQKIIEIVLRNASTILLEKLWEYQNEHMIENSSVCYKEFINTMITKKWLENLLYEYPLLFRVILTEFKNVINFYKEIEFNLKKDYDKLKLDFNINGKLKKIDSNAGDFHKGKKQVLLMEFEFGKILYKPRNLGVDEAFVRLINYINKNLSTNIKVANVYSNETYGWQEFIEYTECESEVQVKSYYKNMGLISCLLYIFMASDMHMENIICNGDSPVFIDLESLFQGYKGVNYKDNSIYQTIVNNIKDSVLSTCLFPAQIDTKSSSDVSGITGHGQQTESNTKFVFENLYTSDMKIVRKDHILEDKKNIPKINGMFIEPRNYIKDIIAGFSMMYKFISENSNEFIRKDGILNSFYNVPIRTIMRDTSSYDILLKAATEPKYMIDASIRQQLFDRLWYIAGVDEKFNDIIPNEIHDLLGGDIPYFTSTINSKHIYGSQGKEISNYYEKTINERIVDKIKNMNPSIENAQIDFIKKSLAFPIKRWDLKENKKDYTKLLPECKILEDVDFLDSSIKIFEMITNLAFIDKNEEDIGWMNLGITSNGVWTFIPMDNTLYDGRLGIGIYAAQLYKLTGIERYKKILKLIINSSFKLDMLPRKEMDLSAFNGNVSVAYCYYYIGCIINNNTLKKEAIQLIFKCKHLVKGDKMFDIISGCAGALIVALRIYKREHIKELLDFAIDCGEHLLNHVFIQDEIYGWPSIAGEGEILTGMSHGNAGISWALTELYKETKDFKYLNCAKRAIRYENTLYSQTDNNWSDMRNRENRMKKGFPDPVNWCHGAPGIGLSRIFCAEIDDQLVNDDEIKSAIQKTLTAGYGGSDCLCHGSFGNLEILLNASNYYHNENYNEIARKIASDLIKESQKQGWICGIPQRSQISGFMTGLSGIGFGLLRVLNSKEVPCILKFDLPVEND